MVQSREKQRQAFVIPLMSKSPFKHLWKFCFFLQYDCTQNSNILAVSLSDEKDEMWSVFSQSIQSLKAGSHFPDHNRLLAATKEDKAVGYYIIVLLKKSLQSCSQSKLERWMAKENWNLITFFYHFFYQLPEGFFFVKFFVLFWIAQCMVDHHEVVTHILCCSSHHQAATKWLSWQNKKWLTDGLVNHFPSSIPSASNRLFNR